MKIRIALAALFGVLAVLGAVLVFWVSDSDDELGGRFDAGLQSEYAPGSIAYFEKQHVHLIRLTDGEFLALYDWDAWAQAQYRKGNVGMEQCRVGILPKDDAAYEGDLQAIRADYAPVEGLEDIVLRGGCGIVFDPLGRRALGPAPADLDRFKVSVDRAGHVIIDLAQRVCDVDSPCLPNR